MTTLLFFRGSNRKGNFLMQMINKRMRLESHRLNQVPVEKASIIEKKLKKINFHLNTDLFEIKNLKEIDHLIYADSILGIYNLVFLNDITKKII
jgi:hypothetical protein